MLAFNLEANEFSGLDPTSLSLVSRAAFCIPTHSHSWKRKRALWPWAKEAHTFHRTRQPQALPSEFRSIQQWTQTMAILRDEGFEGGKCTKFGEHGGKSPKLDLRHQKTFSRRSDICIRDLRNAEELPKQTGISCPGK